MLRRPVAALALLVLPLVVLAPPAASSAERLANGGFELDADLDGAPDGWWGFTAVRAPVPRSGSYALQLALGDIALSGPIPVAAGQTLRFQGWTRATTLVEADLVFTDESRRDPVAVQAVPAYAALAGADGWYAFSAQTVVPMDVTHARVRLQFDAGGNIGPVQPYVLAPAYVDDVSVQLVPGDGNLMFNGGVEINADATPAVPDGWTPSCPSPSAFTLSSTSPRSGARSLDLTDRSSGDTCNAYSPKVPLAAGTRYEYSVEVLVGSGWAGLAFETYSAAGALTEVAFGPSEPTGTDWVRLSLTDCATGADARGRLRVIASNVDGSRSVSSATVRLDNARIVALGAC